MSEPDATAQTGHPDAAGWALGVLDSEESARFETHLESCEDCRQAVAAFGPTALLLKTALPAIEQLEADEPPADLQTRTLAAVELAARKATWRRRGARIVVAAATAAAAIVAAIVVTISLTRPAPALAFSIPLHAPAGNAASGDVTARHNADGWSIQLTVRHLKPLPPGSFYECWYAGPGNQPGHPSLITAGTFVVDSSGNATVQMSSAADPRSFPTMQITAERAGDATQHGPVILSGTVQR